MSSSLPAREGGRGDLELGPGCDFVDWGAFGGSVCGVDVLWVADVECSDNVPVRFGTNGSVDRCEAGFSGAPTYAKSECVCGEHEVLDGARCSRVVFSGHFLVASLH